VKRLLLNNIGLKLLAFAFATALWFFVVGEKEEEVGLVVLLGFKGMPSDMVMVSNPPGDVEVRVVGPRAFINNLTPAQVTADLDLSDARVGHNTFRLQPGNIRIPRGIEVTRIRPTSVEVWMERLVKKSIPVEVELEGVPAAGYKLSGVTVEPGVVVVSGTVKEIKELKKFHTRPVEVSDLTFTKSVSVLLELSNMRFSSVEPDTVQVTVEVEEVLKEEPPVEPAPGPKR
jgi:YbbR domain-containing protein